MSTYTATTWTCDRCGRKAEQTHRNSLPEQPPGWAAIHVVKPPLMNPTESDKRPEQVCVDCVRSFDQWLIAGKDRAAE